MAEETQISTPVESVDVDTSSNVEPTADLEPSAELVADTSTEEPTNEVETAETETVEPQEEKLYAGKYKSVEELEKGYQESQKAFNQVAELRKQIDTMNKAKAEQEFKAQQQALQQAQKRGFDSVEQQQINDYLDDAEYNEYWNYTSALNQEVAPQVQQYLQQGYNLLKQGYSKDAKAYLDEAKRYFPSEFIEQIALLKSQEKTRLNKQFEEQTRQKQDANTRQLADSLKQDYAEFLSDLNDNEGKAEALRAFCNVGSITSKEDMATFQNIYNKIVEKAKNDAIAEYEAQKTIEATKQGSQIEGTTGIDGVGGSMPTYAQFMAMSRDDYNKAVEKYGLETIMNAK